MRFATFSATDQSTAPAMSLLGVAGLGDLHEVRSDRAQDEHHGEDRQRNGEPEVPDVVDLREHWAECTWRIAARGNRGKVCSDRSGLGLALAGAQGVEHLRAE